MARANNMGECQDHGGGAKISEDVPPDTAAWLWPVGRVGINATHLLRKTALGRLSRWVK